MRVPKRLRGQSDAHRHAPVQEQKAARLIKGKTTPGSGSGYQKGDARKRGLVRVECKCTTHKTFTVSRKMVQNLEAGTFGSGEVPVIQVDMLGRFEDDPSDMRLYVVPAWAMEDLLERLTRDPAEQP